MTTRIDDSDYILEEGGAWFEVANFSIRIKRIEEDGCVAVNIFKKGEEDCSPFGTLVVTDTAVE